MPRTSIIPALLLGLATLGWAQDQPVPIRFQVNDALVKESNLDDVSISVAASEAGDPIATGVTDASGGWVAELPPGTCYVTYTKAGYVTIEGTEVEVRGDGQVVTISLLPALESEGGEDGEPIPMRIELILNWGSDQATQVKDADSHLWAEGNQVHVYYAHKEDQAPDGSALALDVDDMDWGGPETITLHGSPPGEYVYWVHDYSGGSQHLGDSDVVVRLIEGNTLLAEYRCEPTVAARMWRPFKSLRVDDQHLLTVIDWTPEELAQNEHLSLPPATDAAVELELGTGFTVAEAMSCVGAFLALIFTFVVAGVLFGKAL